MSLSKTVAHYTAISGFRRGQTLANSTIIRLLVLIVALIAAPLSFSQTVLVEHADDLRQALRNAEAGQIIEIQPGDYFLPSLTLRSHGYADAPILVQAAIPGTVTLWSRHTTLLKLYGAHWHIKNLDFQGNSSANHALHIVQGANAVVVEGNRFQNFHAAIKANGEGNPRQFPDNVRIVRNIFVNDTPRDTRSPVVPIDIIGGRNWDISENFIADIAHAPHRQGRNTSAAFVKGGAYAATFDRNLVICEWRHHGGQRVGLSLGGGGTRSGVFDRRGMEQCGSGDCPETRASRMTNNIILNCPEEPGIYLNNASDSLIANNTVYNAFGIQARFSHTQAEVVDNLLSGTVWERHDGQVDRQNNVTTGWLDSASYLPGLKRAVTVPVAEHRIIYYEWLDGLIRRLSALLIALLDWLAETVIGKGLSRFDQWFLAPQLGNLSLLQDDRIIAQGSLTPRIAHDFCGQRRSSPSDIGAIEYKTGDCHIHDELERRHGPLFTELMAPTHRMDAALIRAIPEIRSVPPPPLRILYADPSNYRQKVRDLQAGDWLQLAPGEYPRPLRLHHLRGTAEHPIVVSGPPQGEPAVLLGRRGSNTISLIDAAHIVIRHLTLDGRQHNIAGVVAEGHGHYAHDITIEHLRIHNYDGSQGNSGIVTRVPAWNWVIRHNEIRDVGTGLYLGRSDGAGPFINGLLEHNFIAATMGYNAQIKHQNVRDRLPGMPTAPQQTIIRYNVFSKAERASSGAQARPNLLLGHWPPQGPGEHDRYLVYANLFYENPHERLFQGEGHLALYNNLFINRRGEGLIVLRHNHVPKNISILQNTVVAAGFGIRIDQPDRDYQQHVVGNAVFAEQPLVLPRRVEQHGNYTAELAAANSLLVNPDAGLAALDLYPRGYALQSRDDPGWMVDLPDLDRDYNHRPRQPGWYGAYASGDAVNPGRLEGQTEQ